MLTLQKVASELHSLGLTIRPDLDEYRVNYRRGSIVTAEYARDLQEALTIGRDMAGGATPLCRHCGSTRMNVFRNAFRSH